MKITFITGSYPPDACGVGDYTYRLAEALRLQGITVEIVHDEDWSLCNVPRLLRRIKALHSDLVHLQYPTIGFGAHLTPQVLSVLCPGVVTLHEVRQSHILRRLSLYPYSVRSHQIIFTTVHERDYAIKWAPWILNRCSVIPTGTNIKKGDQNKIRDLKEIVYFGLIRPDKGLEDIFALAALIKSSSLPLGVRIIGKPYPKCIDYYEKLRKQSEHLPVTWNIGLPGAAVGDILSSSLVAYMPFPDGASERRTSLMALLANGVATVTTQSKTTPSELNRVVEFARSPEHALQVIQRVIADKELIKTLSDNARAYANNFTWDAIALKHKELYSKILWSTTLARRK